MTKKLNVSFCDQDRSGSTITVDLINHGYDLLVMVAYHMCFLAPLAV